MNVPGDNARAVSVTIMVVVVVVSPASADAANPRGLVDSADASGVDRRRRIREDVFPARAGVQFAIITQRSLQLSVVPTRARRFVTLRRHARDDDEERGYEDESHRIA